MMRLIDADELREYWLYNGLNENIYDTNDVLESIDEQPTVGPEALRPTAHWIKCDLIKVEHGECTRYKDAGIECSKCNHVYDKFALWDGTFCPGCGSRMIGCEDGEHR